MSKPISEDDFIQIFSTHGAQQLSNLTGVDLSSIYRRRRRIELHRKITISPPNPYYRNQFHPQQPQYAHRLQATLKDGIILVGSDSHYWPKIISTAHRAFVLFCSELKPKIVVKNGDVIDGATISRHSPIGWENRPSLVSEIEAAQDRLGEIEKASKKARLVWPLGNHDMRFGTRLATVAPEYAKLHGVHLKDHFGQRWEPCWSFFVNQNVVIKHRFKGGVHATHNNTLHAGLTMVTGHLHALKVTPFDDYNGIRYGVDTGTLADPSGPQFTDYLEDNPTSWRSGFAVLTFRNGQLLWPELAHVMDEGAGLVQFRGEVFRV